MHLCRNFILRQLMQEPFRALTTLFGIALGIAVIVAIQLAKESSVDGFRQAIDQMAGKAALEFTSPGGLSEARLKSLLEYEKFGVLCPVIQGEARHGETPLQILGVDILKDQEVRDYELVDFGSGRTQPTPREFLDLLKDPDSLILTEKYARSHNLKVGDRILLSFADAQQDMRVAALLMDKGTGAAVDGNIVLMDIAAAQWRLQRVGRIDRLELKLNPGRDVAKVEQLIQETLPPGITVQRPERRGAEVEKMLQAYHYNLTLLSGIAFLAGLYVIYNAVSLSVIRRRGEIGMLRTLGVTRREVAKLFLMEAALLAVPGCFLGLYLGQALAHGTVQLTQLTTATLYTQSQVLLVPLSLALALPVFCVGVLLSLLAALRPALEAARLSPMAAVRLVDLAVLARRNWYRRWIMAAILGGLAFLCTQLPPWQGLPVFGTLACLLAVGSLSVVTPLLWSGFLKLLRRPMSESMGASGQLAWGNLSSGQHRLAIPVSALGGTLALTTAIAIMVGSFRETLTYWVDNSLAADLYIRPGTKQGVGNDAPFSETTLRILKSDPDLLAVDALRNMDISFRDSRIVLNTADFTVAKAHGKLLFQNTKDWRNVLEDCLTGGQVVISEPMALRYQLKPGDTLEIPTPQGPVGFPIRDIYYDYSNDRGSVTMDHRTYERYYGPVQPTNLAAYLKPNADPDAVRTRLLEALGAATHVQIFTNRSLRQEVMRIFDRTFSITWALEAISILVAMAGVATTILTLVLERKEELQILRMLGASRVQLRRTLAMEAGVIGLLSQLIGLGLGFVLSLVLIFVINVQSFGWTIQYRPPGMLLLQFSFLLPVATAFAGWCFAASIQRAALKGADQTRSPHE
jgi:putative ABC transport system permease protein